MNKVLEPGAPEGLSGSPAAAAVLAARAQAPDVDVLPALDLVMDALELRRLCAAWGNEAQRTANLDALRAHASSYCDERRAGGDAPTLVGFLSWMGDLADESRWGKGRSDTAARVGSEDAITVSTWRKVSLPDQEPLYRAMAGSRQVLRAAANLTVSSGPFSLCGSFALASAALIPPFFPVGRGEDLLFGQMVRRCFDDQLLGHLPWAIGHFPLPPRRNRMGQLWSRRPRYSLSVLVSHAIDLAELRVAPTGAARLRLLGHHLRELSALPWPELDRVIRDQIWRQSGGYLLRLSERIERSRTARRAWALDARAYHVSRTALLDAPEALVPVALRHGRSLPDAQKLFQRLLERYGQLLEVWPALYGTARQMHEDPDDREGGSTLGRVLA